MRVQDLDKLLKTIFIIITRCLVQNRNRLLGVDPPSVRKHGLVAEAGGEVVVVVEAGHTDTEDVTQLGEYQLKLFVFMFLFMFMLIFDHQLKLSLQKRKEKKEGRGTKSLLCRVV